jgi:hypothetical protein
MTEAQRASFPKRFPPDPGLHYVPLAAGADGSHGAVIARIDGSTRATGKYESVKFVLEEGSWKVDLESFDDSPLDPRGLYALVPPGEGAFARAGSPWAAIPYSVSNTQFFKENELDWKMQATQDESFLYVRFEAKTPLPAPRTEVYKDKSRPGSPVDTGAPSPPPAMKIKLEEAGAAAPNNQEFTFQASDVVRTRSTFDKNGKANSNRFFVVYALSLRGSSDATIFDANTDDTVARLVAVNDRVFDLKIPLKSLGAEGTSSITLQEANSFPKILPYQVGKFAPQPQ